MPGNTTEQDKQDRIKNWAQGMWDKDYDKKIK